MLSAQLKAKKSKYLVKRSEVIRVEHSHQPGGAQTSGAELTVREQAPGSAGSQSP